jgi:hypothetical protein
LTADVTMQVGRRTEDLKVEDNFDVALHKSMKLTESKMLELRLETFNTFNHAQLYPNGSVDGNTSSPTFGRVLKATPARIGQLALKLTF